ncbi:hypothetical protein BDW02DRAFT_614463 [Decorospora gaudefroyi]|uniref:Uncharacterized protein n=1 Tax=Decorospora gaudefroyi TaxID=184978 RepID=A0A6A5KLX9_9PLEO|nr:hypothetical protein BDW02DRAFT_614463 [Decorospora gaudefroyi]
MNSTPSTTPLSSSTLELIASRAEKRKPRENTRFPPAGFGSRLAAARNLAHTEVPHALPREEMRLPVDTVISGVANSVRPPASTPAGLPRHGWEKGSYRSPFDYNIPRHTVGGKSIPARHSPFFAGFGDSSHTFPTTDRHRVSPANEELDEPAPRRNRAVTPAPEAKERLLLLDPLRVIRNSTTALRADDRTMLHEFIDSYMADSLHTVIERDATIPAIIYKSSIPMTDENWRKYNQLVAVFENARGMHEMIAKGSTDFDKYTYIVDSVHAREEHTEGWRVLADAVERGRDTQALLQELVQIWRGMWTEDGSGYTSSLKD